MVRLHFSIQLNYDVGPAGADFIFNIHAAHTPQQQVVAEDLYLSPTLAFSVDTEPASRNRFLRLQAPGGPLQVRYEATVDIAHHRAAPQQLREVPVAQLPSTVLPFLYPSRYCQSDRLQKFAFREFGPCQPGYPRALAICQWVQQHVHFAPNTSNSSTSAVDTLIEGAGVCRDFAHLMIALCRASNLPARFATGIDYGADPALGPTDFHAYVEVFLGHCWYLFDPSGTAIPMGFLRFATGRDAADAAFATLFGAVTSSAPVIQIEAVANQDGVVVTPQHVNDALSTDRAWALA